MKCHYRFLANRGDSKERNRWKRQTMNNKKLCNFGNYSLIFEVILRNDFKTNVIETHVSFWQKPKRSIVTTTHIHQNSFLYERKFLNHRNPSKQEKYLLFIRYDFQNAQIIIEKTVFMFLLLEKNQAFTTNDFLAFTSTILLPLLASTFVFWAPILSYETC